MEKCHKAKIKQLSFHRSGKLINWLTNSTFNSTLKTNIMQIVTSVFELKINKEVMGQVCTAFSLNYRNFLSVIKDEAPNELCSAPLWDNQNSWHSLEVFLSCFVAVIQAVYSEISWKCMVFKSQFNPEYFATLFSAI